jgi:hypothetical protein
MTGKIGAAIVSAGLALGAVGCLSFYEIPVEVPIQSKIDVTAFQRVLVAGFLTAGTKSIDPNTETARLLRSQLRTKQDLRVIDADVLALSDEAAKRAGTTMPAAAAPAPQAAAQTPTTPTALTPEDKALAAQEAIFSDTAFWKNVGQTYQSPLIVTGTVAFTEIKKSGEVTRAQPYTDANGVEQYRQVRQFVDQQGYALTPKFVFIDGRTGALLYSETYHEEALYASGQNTPALSSYFELMDKVLPSFLNTLSTQKIKGTRILLK